MYFLPEKSLKKLVVPKLSTSTLCLNDEYFKKEEDVVWGFKIKTAQLKGNVILNATSLVLVCSTVVATSEKKGTCSASLLPFRRKLQLLFFLLLSGV